MPCTGRAEGATAVTGGKRSSQALVFMSRPFSQCIAERTYFVILDFPRGAAAV